MLEPSIRSLAWKMLTKQLCLLYWACKLTSYSSSWHARFTSTKWEVKIAIVSVDVQARCLGILLV